MLGAFMIMHVSLKYYLFNHNIFQVSHIPLSHCQLRNTHQATTTSLSMLQTSMDRQQILHLKCFQHVCTVHYNATCSHFFQCSCSLIVIVISIAPTPVATCDMPEEFQIYCVVIESSNIDLNVVSECSYDSGPYDSGPREPCVCMNSYVSLIFVLATHYH